MLHQIMQINRKQEIHQITGLQFPKGENSRAGMLLDNTIFDGELVVDVDCQTREVRFPGGPVRVGLSEQSILTASFHPLLLYAR